MKNLESVSPRAVSGNLARTEDRIAAFDAHASGPGRGAGSTSPEKSMTPKNTPAFERLAQLYSKLSKKMLALILEHLPWVLERADQTNLEDARDAATDALVKAVRSHKKRIPSKSKRPGKKQPTRAKSKKASRSRNGRKPKTKMRPGCSLEYWIRLKVDHALQNLRRKHLEYVVGTTWQEFRGTQGHPPTLHELCQAGIFTCAEVLRVWSNVVSDFRIPSDEDLISIWLDRPTLIERSSSYGTPSPTCEDAMAGQHLEIVLSHLSDHDQFLLRLGKQWRYSDKDILEAIKCAEILVELGWDPNELTGNQMFPELPVDAELPWDARLLGIRSRGGLRIRLHRALRAAQEIYLRKTGRPHPKLVRQLKKALADLADSRSSEHVTNQFCGMHRGFSDRVARLRAMLNNVESFNFVNNTSAPPRCQVLGAFVDRFYTFKMISRSGARFVTFALTPENTIAWYLSSSSETILHHATSRWMAR